MSTYPSIPATVELKRGRLVVLIAGIAALTAVVTWAISVYAFQSGTTPAATPAAVQGYTPRHLDTMRSPSIMSLTAADLAANALGMGYALPSPRKGGSMESVLASMSPQTREYTKRIMNLTFAQLAAGAAGQP